MKKMPTARGHHYIPKCYLKGFSRKPNKEAKLHVFDLHTGEWLPGPTNHKNIGKVRDFNRIDMEGHLPDALENSLATFESVIAKVLREEVWGKRERPQGETWIYLVNLMAMLSVRNPQCRENFRDFQKRVIEQITDLTLATKERYESSVRQMKEAGHGTDLAEVPYEEVVRFHKEKQYEIVIPNQRFFAGEFGAIDGVIKTLLSRKWTFLIADDVNHFICGDHPVRLRWAEPKLAAGFYSPGHGLRKSEVLFPVSKDLALVGSFEGEERTVVADRFMVAMINTLILEGCDRHIYSSRDNFEFIGPDHQILPAREIRNYFRRVE